VPLLVCRGVLHDVAGEHAGEAGRPDGEDPWRVAEPWVNARPSTKLVEEFSRLGLSQLDALSRVVRRHVNKRRFPVGQPNEQRRVDLARRPAGRADDLV
jgi:hypothetical protein